METNSATSEIAQSPPLAGERVAFTGTLASMTHREAMDRVAENGGAASEHVSRQTTMLVIGEEGWPLESDGKTSVKLQQVEKLIADGVNIRVVRESEWLGFVGLTNRRDELHRRCTPAMLSRMLDISVHDVRRWERMGLIKAVEHVYRLPYFDFHEVSNARRLAELVEAGIPIREIKTSLSRLEAVVGIGARTLAQLEILVADHHLLYRDSLGRLKTSVGQLLFEFDNPELSEEATAETIPLPEPAEAMREHWTPAQ